MKKIRVGIIGGAGYTGGELLRILVHHPSVDICFVHSKSNAGKPLSAVHSDLLGESDLAFSEPAQKAAESYWQEAELLFLCLGHGQSKVFLSDHRAFIAPGTKVIDLSQDFRVAQNGQFSEWHGKHFVYGLPEVYKDQIREAEYVANPGCFATAIELGLLPLAHEGLLGEVYATGITGSTGAGQGLTETSHFSWRANNIQAYKTLTHQHLAEIHQLLHDMQPNFPLNPTAASLHFVPWRGDFTRGIFVSSQTRCTLDLPALEQLYQAYYEDHPFTALSQDSIYLKQVVNTNKCVLQLEKIGRERLVVHSALDNLLKGASGQAVQNMNLMCGLDESLGLRFKASFF